VFIGPYAIASNLAVAPMAGVTDRPFRQLCRRLGAGYAVSEMVASNPQLFGTGKSQRRIDHRGESSPIVVQIAGADPAMMADAARYNVAHGAEIIDINMGCPAKKVCNVAAGSALLRDEARVAAILRAVVAAVDVPVTLKIRTGWSRERPNGVAVARIAESAGVQALAVHGRSRACRFEGEAEYETIAAIKQAVRIPVIANGDIDSAAKASEVIRATGVDGVMIGRAAQGRPWIFREIEARLAGKPAPPEPSAAETRDIITAHLCDLYAFYGVDAGVRIARKHIGWYCRERPHAQAFRQSVMRVDTAEGQLDAVREFFDARREAEAA